MVDDWLLFSDLNIKFAQILNRESGRSACRLWRINPERAVLPLIPRNSPGAMWLAWQKPRPKLACALEISDFACEVAEYMNAWRYDLMSNLLNSSVENRERVIQAEYRVPFKFMIRKISWACSPGEITLRKSDVLPEFHVFQVGPDSDCEEIVTSEEVLLYSGGKPEFKIAA